MAWTRGDEGEEDRCVWRWINQTIAAARTRGSKPEMRRAAVMQKASGNATSSWAHMCSTCVITVRVPYMACRARSEIRCSRVALSGDVRRRRAERVESEAREATEGHARRYWRGGQRAVGCDVSCGVRSVDGRVVVSRDVRSLSQSTM